mmetsp:Transcript_24157/g.54242  ORF Transcript_24157/g.54242 Transcript_24157/m.54242 type:complete len:105 (-) Transcript_24157:1135-1449(-)
MVQPASDEDCLSAPGTVRAAVLGLKGGEAQARYAARCGSAGRELLSNIMALQGIMFRQMLPPLPLPHNLPHTLSPLPLPHTPSPLPLPHTLPHTLPLRRLCLCG